MNSVFSVLREGGVLPVINLKSKTQEDTLLAGLEGTGVSSVEVTLRSTYSIRAIESIRERRPEMLVGAGTVMSISDYERAICAGAQYIVSPGLDIEIVERCLRDGIPVFPGCATPSEIMLARKLGLKVVKFFPADINGGVGALKLYESVFADLEFLPTGGINLDNIGLYFGCKNVIACGGSFIAPSGMLDSGDAEGVRALINKACGIHRDIRGNK